MKWGLFCSTKLLKSTLQQKQSQDSEAQKIIYFWIIHCCIAEKNVGKQSKAILMTCLAVPWKLNCFIIFHICFMINQILMESNSHQYDFNKKLKQHIL